MGKDRQGRTTVQHKMEHVRHHVQGWNSIVSDYKSLDKKVYDSAESCKTKAKDINKAVDDAKRKAIEQGENLDQNSY